MNLSSINLPSNRTKRWIDVKEIKDQNVYKLEFSSDCIYVGGTMKSSMLHQLRDQILPDSELNFSGNLSRDNFSNNYLNEVKDQNLPDFNLAK